MEDNRTIELDHNDQKFYTKLNGEKGYIDFEVPEEGVIDLKHTFVPEDYRDEGIASQLASFAFQYARKKNLKVIPTCNYIKSFLEEHQQYEDLLVEK